MERLYFSSDYMEGAYPSIMERLMQTNMEHTDGYGMDSYCESAKKRIREACNCPDADVYFLVGGTQTNATVINSFLPIYQGVIAPDTGHISLHESGAIEAGGHKVLSIPANKSKITALQLADYLKSFYDDDNHEHMVMPGMVYITQPTEYGTLYSKAEIEDISDVCHQYKIPLYLDGARLAYALASPENDVTLADLARLCDAFYIGGTKCGAMLGEAVVFPQKGRIPHFFTIIKQHGALFAKGRILGIQFDELFRDGLYGHIGDSAIEYSHYLQETLKEMGYELLFETPTNQIFCILSDEEMKRLDEKVSFSFWEKYDDSHTVIRFAMSWATKKEDVEKLIKILKELR